MATRGLVFDLDGTLVDSLSFTLKAFNYGIESEGGTAFTASEIMKYFGGGEGDIFTSLIGPEKSAAAFLAYQDYVENHLHEMPLHEGIGDLLELAKSSSVPIAIFTGRSWPTTEVILKHLKIMDRFITVVASDHVNMPKPSPEGLHLALSRMSLRPEEALFIGDSSFDIQAARAAGSVGVAALWDFLADRAELERHQPHHFVSKPAEVWELWKKLSC